MVYLAAFIVSVWWIVEAEAGAAGGEDDGGEGVEGGDSPPIPAPAYLLCLGYLAVAAASVFMLIGLYKKRERALLVWVFVMTLFCFPEMGMVAFMVFVHWKITSTYGLADLVFYVLRAAFNLLSVLCVQSQYATWRDELVNSHTLKRLEHLHMNSLSKSYVGNETSLAYHNPAFLPAPESPPASLPTSPVALSRSYSRASLYSGVPSTAGVVREAPPLVLGVSNQMGVPTQLGGQGQMGATPIRMGVPGWDPYVARESQSEFNAAMFTPASMGFMPLVSSNSRSEVTLHGGSSNGGGLTVYHHNPTQVLYPHQHHQVLTPTHQYFSTQSLDRRRYMRRGSGMGMGDGLSLQAGLLAGPGVVGFVRTAQESRSSLGAESDDLRRYRDVAL